MTGNFALISFHLTYHPNANQKKRRPLRVEIVLADFESRFKWFEILRQMLGGKRATQIKTKRQNLDHFYQSRRSRGKRNLALHGRRYFLLFIKNLHVF